MQKDYETLLLEVRSLQQQGKLPIWPTDEQRADWAYGNAVIENDKVTRQMAEEAVARNPAPHDQT